MAKKRKITEESRKRSFLVALNLRGQVSVPKIEQLLKSDHGVSEGLHGYSAGTLGVYLSSWDHGDVEGFTKKDVADAKGFALELLKRWTDATQWKRAGKAAAPSTPVTQTTTQEHKADEPDTPLVTQEHTHDTVSDVSPAPIVPDMASVTQSVFVEHTKPESDLVPQSVAVPQLDDHMLSALGEIVAWWDNRKEGGLSMDMELPIDGLRPDFSREATEARSIRMDKRLWSRAKKLAESRKFRGVTGGNVNGLCEWLIWRFCGSPQDLLKPTEPDASE